jgi:UDP-N-acetylglucosamine--N-acetylmuramyl-(pentapeptide) pyrophosphoryl-undecaprenol N-acetylglucosamine transferase
VVSGGGTAGHVYPSLTVAEHLRDEELCDVAFVGTPDGMEARLAEEAGLTFYAVKSKGFDRGSPLSLVAAVWTTIASWMRSMRYLRRFKPDVVVGFGGYVSLPVGLAAAVAGIPLVLHEQNAVPGLANRVLSRWATTVCVTYPASIERLAHPERAFVTGNPVRPAVMHSDREAGRRALKVKGNDLVLLVFGGSRGARHINTAMLSLYKRLKDVRTLKVVHIAGPLEAEAVRAELKSIDGRQRAFWQVHDYIDRMGDVLAAADLVVCRAGATTLAELTALGKASILVPYPFATEDHQTLNAQSMVRAGAAVMISDAELDAPVFGDELVRLLTHPESREVMATASAALARPLAAHAVAEAAVEAAAARLKAVGMRPAPDGPSSDKDDAAVGGEAL